MFESLWKDAGCPDYMFFDTRPASYPMVLITSHEMAEQITKITKQQPYSTTKSPTLSDGLRGIIGRYSLVSEEGETWKALRKQFNPGFAPTHILTLLPIIVEKTYIFMGRLDAAARSDTVTELEPLCTNVTFDIIGEVVTNIDCQAQDPETQGNDIVKNFRTLVEAYAGTSGISFDWMNVLKQTKKYMYSRRLDAAVKTCVKDKWESMQADGVDKRDRSVLALALKDVEHLTPLTMQHIADQVKTFLLAGHDTTSILLQWAIYALSIHPQCLEKIRAEHDSIFGNSDPKEVFLSRPDDTIQALVYTSAVIKETLRLWPPAGSARMSHNGLTLRTTDGEEVCLDNCILYIIHTIIQRDAKVYGDTANDFMPERWLNENVDENGSLTEASKIPVSSWRPFERGPRNCIGQELANLEAKVILACVMRRYDFVKVGMGEVERDEKGQAIVGEKGKYKTKSELLNVSITRNERVGSC
jgi:cytochrome P450